MGNVAVFGAGSWGTALAIVLADNKNHVKLWSYSHEQVVEINDKRTNNKYLPNIELPKNIVAYSRYRKNS